MKKIQMALYCCALSAISLTAQISENREEHEKKDGLHQMIRERLYPSGDSGNFGRYTQEMISYRNNNPQQLTANWSYLDASGNLNGDIGRTNSITFDTLNANRFYVCSPHSGVWLTNDNGASYTPITETLPTQSTSQLVIDPSNTNTLYLATGSHNMDMLPNSLGVFKSTDGGANWNQTGLAFQASAVQDIGDLIINPQNYNSLLAATSDGLYRTYNGGTTWTRILNDFTCSVRFAPGDTTTIYVGGHDHFRSTDAGASFSPMGPGIQNDFYWTYEFYVRTTTLDPNAVYISTGGIDSGFVMKFYIHKSTDKGQTFVPMDSLNGEPCMQFEVSQQTADKYIAGYHYLLKRDNSSSTFGQFTQSNPNLTGYVHTDQRGIYFDPHNDSILYICNDGGLYRSTDNGVTFQNISANMQLAHIYNLSNSQNTGYKILVAPLDVSPYIIGSSGIDQTFSQLTEAFSCWVNPMNDSLYWMAHHTPLFTENNGSSFYTSSNPLIGNMAYNGKLFQYNQCQEEISYFGAWSDIFKSTDYGHNYLPIGNTGHNFSEQMGGLAVSRTNPNYIYVFYNDSLYLTTSGDSSFAVISGGLPIGLAAISSITVDPANEKNIWVSFSGYSAGNKIFRSTDAGQNWTNISAGLPNIPVNSIVCQKGVPGAVYAATDGGVFYIDDNFSSWQYFNTGMPNVIVNSVDIQYNSGKLRAGTFGRGSWESDLHQLTPANYELPPLAVFTASTACTGSPVIFTNHPCATVNTYEWFFPGGIPATSTLANPSVTYASPGSYDVTLIVSGPGGNDTITEINFVRIATSASIPFFEDVPDLNAYQLPYGFTATEVNNDGYHWHRTFSFGSSGMDDDCLMYDNFSYYLADMEEGIILPPMDLSAASSPKLYFKHAYATRSQSPVLMDTLKVKARICGGADTLLFMEGGQQLTTTTTYYPFATWTPYQLSDWRSDSIDLSMFAGESAVTISFLNKGHWGQALYLDAFEIRDVNITTDLANTNPASAISVYPNPATDKLNIHCENNFPMNALLTDITGRTAQSWVIENTDTTVSVSGLAPGLYLLHLGNSVFIIEKR